MTSANLLGEFLRARREKVMPADVGLHPGGRRVVAGLRREEVALLAGVSAAYYLRLEQGRDRHPSPQVLASLGRVLLLDEAATAHLMTLGSPSPAPGRRGEPVRVPSSIRQLLRALTLPTFVEDKHFDVQASNPAARALVPSIVPGRNRLLSTFLDLDDRSLFLEWEVVAAELVAGFRASVAGSANDQRTADLVSELSAASGLFAHLWAEHEVADLVDRPPVRLLHPEVGALTLTRDNVAVDGRNGLRLVVYHAEPGSDSYTKLMVLGQQRASD